MCSPVAIHSFLSVYPEVEKWSLMINIRSVVCKCIPGGASIVVDISWHVQCLKLQKPELAVGMASGLQHGW